MERPHQRRQTSRGRKRLGIEIRANDETTARYVRVLDHAETHAAALAERALLRMLEGGCQIPIGAWARVEEGRMVLDAMVGSIDGSLRLDARGTSSTLAGAEALGRRVARKLLANGAKEILDDIRSQNG